MILYENKAIRRASTKGNTGVPRHAGTTMSTSPSVHIMCNYHTHTRHDPLSFIFYPRLLTVLVVIKKSAFIVSKTTILKVIQLNTKPEIILEERRARLFFEKERHEECRTEIVSAKTLFVKQLMHLRMEGVFPGIFTRFLRVPEGGTEVSLWSRFDKTFSREFVLSRKLRVGWAHGISALRLGSDRGIDPPAPMISLTARSLTHLSAHRIGTRYLTYTGYVVQSTHTMESPPDRSASRAR